MVVGRQKRVLGNQKRIRVNEMNTPKEVETTIVYLVLMAIFMYLLSMSAFFITLDVFIRCLMVVIYLGWLVYTFKVVWDLVKGLNEYHLRVFKVNMDAEKELRENLRKKYEGE